jgi:hypothetical protein
MNTDMSKKEVNQELVYRLAYGPERGAEIAKEERLVRAAQNNDAGQFLTNSQLEAVTGGGNAPRFEVKQMLEAQGTRFGIYKDGQLYEAGYVTEIAALELVAQLQKLPVAVWDR